MIKIDIALIFSFFAKELFGEINLFLIFSKCRKKKISELTDVKTYKDVFLITVK